MRTRQILPSGFVTLALLLGSVAPLRAVPDQSAAEAIESEREIARVELDGALIVRVRGTSAYPAAQRAAEITERIRRLAADPGFDPSTIAVRDETLGPALIAGATRLFVVTSADAELEHAEPAAIAQITRANVIREIGRYRQSRSRPELLAGILRATLGTVALAAALLALNWIGRRIDEPLTLRLRRSRAVAAGDALHPMFGAERAIFVLRTILRLLRWAALLTLAYVALAFVLEQLPWTRSIARGLRHLILAPLDELGRAFVAWIPDLLFLLLLIFATRGLLRMVRGLFQAVAEKRIRLGDFDPEWALPTLGLVRLAIIALAAVVAYPYIPGSGSDAFKGLSLFFGVLFSLGSSSAVSNVVSGYSLLYRRAFRDGDRIAVGDVVGDVVKRRLQSTHLRTTKNEEVVIPNSAVAARDIKNFSALARTEGLILHTTAGIGYETPWRQVEAMLTEAALRTPGILREPPPFVLILELADFAVTYELNARTDDAAAMPRLYTLLHQNVLDVFNEYGVQIMTPAYRADTDPPKLVERKDWYLAPARPPESEPPADR
ncbi:MAG: mechanosensitive ion channel family protein [Thermoanaerobaculia bacterium]